MSSQVGLTLKPVVSRIRTRMLESASAKGGRVMRFIEKFVLFVLVAMVVTSLPQVVRANEGQGHPVISDDSSGAMPDPSHHPQFHPELHPEPHPGQLHPDAHPAAASDPHGDHHLDPRHFGARSHMLEAIIHGCAHGELAFCAAVMAELHTHRMRAGVGLLFDVSGAPGIGRRGRFEFQTRLVVHAHDPSPMDLRCFVGLSYHPFHDRLSFNSGCTFTLTWNVSPYIAPVVNVYPEMSAFPENLGTWRLDVPIGVRFRLPFHRSPIWFVAAMVATFDDMHIPDVVHPDSFIFRPGALFLWEWRIG